MMLWPSLPFSRRTLVATSLSLLVVLALCLPAGIDAVANDNPATACPAADIDTHPFVQADTMDDRPSFAPDVVRPARRSGRFHLQSRSDEVTLAQFLQRDTPAARDEQDPEFEAPSSGDAATTAAATASKILLFRGQAPQHTRSRHHRAHLKQQQEEATRRLRRGESVVTHTLFTAQSYNPPSAAVGMNGDQVSVVANVGGQNVQLFLSTLQDTVVGTNDLFSTSGYTPGDSSTASLASVCSSTPCTVTYNATSANLFGPYGFSGPVYQDKFIVGYADGTNRTVTDGQFVAASSRSGTAWPYGNSALLPPSTSNVGQFGMPTNTTICYGATCFTGVYGNILSTFSLSNIVGICANYSVGSVVSLGGAESSLYTGSITYASIASSSSFNVSVVSGYEDSIVVTALTYDGTDLTAGEGTSAIGAYSIVELDSPYLLFQDIVYRTLQAQIVNTIDPTKNVNADTANLTDILYDEITNNLTVAAYFALPSINVTVSLDESTSTNLLIPPQAYMPAFESWQLPTVTLNVVPSFNSTVNFQSVTGNNTVLGLPLHYAYYLVYDRANERIGFATPANSCSIGCGAINNQTSCDAEPNCSWCFNPLQNNGVCVESTPYGAASPTANSIYVCPVSAATSGASGLMASYWTLMLLVLTSMGFLLS